MRHNHDRHSKDTDGRYDRVYVDWPRLYSVRSIIARPLKTIYINRSAAGWALDRTFTGVAALESFCERWGVELP